MKVKVFKKKLLMVSALYSAFQLVSNPAVAGGDLPSGGVVKSGDIDISRASDSLRILQKTDKGIIEWQDFSVGKHKSVHFQQPSKTSATLNRVTGDFTSQIAGQITATGQVFLVNPNGILITKDGTINTQGFIASTMDITDYNFNKSNYIFSQKGKTGLVENQGTIDVADGGVVALLGGAVKNTGTVNAHLGKISFAGGERIVLSFGDNDFLRVEVPVKDLSTIKDANGNPISDVLDIGGTVTADGGMVQLTVATAAKILRQRISMGGRVQVNTAVRKNGIIRISGGDVKLDKDAKLIANNGSVKIDADTLTSSAVVQASGGNIAVDVAGDNTLHTGASFDVSGAKAGKIAFTAGTRKVSRFKSKADFKADSTAGTGGYIDITANKGFVWLVSGTLSAKGITQGGRIRVGGAFQGGGYDGKISRLNKRTKDSFVNRWADNSTLDSTDDLKIESAVNINTTASAGYGGTVILWSDKTTDNTGKVDARGVDGQGGSVEISAKKDLISAGSRVHFNGGELLLDPKNWTITDWTDVGGVNIKSSLEDNNSTQVTLLASNDITVNAGLDTTSDTGKSGKLVLIAGRSIIINQDVKVKGGLELKANTDDYSSSVITATNRDTGSAVITVATGKTISGGDQDLIIKMLNGDSSAADNKKYSGAITVWKADGKRVSIVHNGTKFNSGFSEIVIRDGGKITSTATDLTAGDVGIELKAKLFTNNSTASALTVNDPDGRYLVWTTHPSGNTFGKTGSFITSYDFAQFNKSYNTSGGNFQSNTTQTSGNIKTGSGFIYSFNQKLVFTIRGVPKTKVYDGNANASKTSLKLVFKGVANSDSVLSKDNMYFKIGGYSNSPRKHQNIKVNFDASTATAKFMNVGGNAEQKDVGTSLRIKYSGETTYTDGNNKVVYGISKTIDHAVGASITQRTLKLSVADLKVTNKVFVSGNVNAPVVPKSGKTGFAVADATTGVVGSDAVSLKIDSQAFVYDTDTIGNNKQVKWGTVANVRLDGAKKGNYTLDLSSYKRGDTISGLTGNVAKAVLSITINVNDKPYDGTTSLTVASNGKGTILGGWIDNSLSKNWDNVFKSSKNRITAVANSKDAGKTVGVTFSGLELKQAYKDKGYTIQYASKTVEITKKTLTLDPTDFNPIIKTYDNTGRILGSQVSLKKNASGLNGTIDGDDITLTVGDDAFLTASRDVGSATVQIWKADKLILTGQDAKNYNFNYKFMDRINGLKRTITPKVITLKMDDYTVDSKFYDGTKVVKGAQIKLKSGRKGFYYGSGKNQVFEDDKNNVTLSAEDGALEYIVTHTHPVLTLSFADSSKLKLTGIQAKNYKVFAYAPNTDSGLKAGITPKIITLNASDFNPITRVYNAQKHIDPSEVTLKKNTTGLVGIESVDKDKIHLVLGRNMFSYETENAGTDIKIVWRNGSRLGGTGVGNYLFDIKIGGMTGLTGTITQKVVTLNTNDFKPITKTYDGGATVAAATVSLKTDATGLSGVIPHLMDLTHPEVNLTIKDGALVYASKNVNGAIQLNVADKTKLELSGAHAKNYKFSYSANANSGLKGAITPKTVTLKLADLEVLSRNYHGGDKSATVVLKTARLTGLNNAVSGDDIRVKAEDGAFEFVTDTPGNTKQVNWKDKNKVKLDGTDKGNYTLDLSSYTNGRDSTLRGKITEYVITLTANVQARAYNGGTALTLVKGSIKWTTDATTQWKSGETDMSISSVTQGSLVANAEFKNAGRQKVIFSGKTLTTTYASKGYTLAFDVTKIVFISHRVLTLKTEDFRPITKTYDGDNKLAAAKVVFKVEGDRKGLSGVVGVERVFLTIKDGALVFDNENAAANKQINIADKTKLQLSGVQDRRYFLLDKENSSQHQYLYHPMNGQAIWETQLSK